MDKSVIELFAGVGGFRVGLNEVKLKKNGDTNEKNNFNILWANQWEPATKQQDAFNCYARHFKDQDNISNENIQNVDVKSIPNHSLLVGGFPCQDYSVARSKANEKGIEGKKGVLWWEINRILSSKRPPFILLENVDRLTKSPAKQRGRDFGIMLRCLDNLGYGVEWRVINAADYGFTQKRRRTYIFGFHKSTEYYKEKYQETPSTIFSASGIFARTFPALEINSLSKINIGVEIYKNLVELSDKFSFEFQAEGLMLKSVVYTCKIVPNYIAPIALKNLIQQEQVEEKFYLDDLQIKKFKYLKGSKKIKRMSKQGINYFYSEGAMCFPDNLECPARTMLTSEGTTNRSTHVILDQTNRLRFLTPIEAERINQFPDNWTNTNMSYKRRFFMMGNALVCGVITKLGKTISAIIDSEK